MIVEQEHTEMADTPEPDVSSRTGRGFWLFLGLAIALIAIDQLTKYWVRFAAQGTENQTISSLWPGVFEIKLVYNEGIAFGMFQGWGILLWPIAIGIAFSAGLYSFRHPKDRPILHVAMALLAAGAVGNLIDRIIAGRVTDLFFIRAINFPVFNVADACITLAAAILGWFWMADALFGHRKHPVPRETETRPTIEQ